MIDRITESDIEFPKIIYGRKKILNRLIETSTSYLGSHHLLFGPPGIGKTAVLQTLEQRLENREDTVVFYYSFKMREEESILFIIQRFLETFLTWGNYEDIRNRWLWFKHIMSQNLRMDQTRKFFSFVFQSVKNILIPSILKPLTNVIEEVGSKLAILGVPATDEATELLGKHKVYNSFEATNEVIENISTSLEKHIVLILDGIEQKADWDWDVWRNLVNKNYRNFHTVIGFRLDNETKDLYSKISNIYPGYGGRVKIELESLPNEHIEQWLVEECEPLILEYGIEFLVAESAGFPRVVSAWIEDTKYNQNMPISKDRIEEIKQYVVSNDMNFIFRHLREMKEEKKALLILRSCLEYEIEESRFFHIQRNFPKLGLTIDNFNILCHEFENEYFWLKRNRKDKRAITFQHDLEREAVFTYACKIPIIEPFYQYVTEYIESTILPLTFHIELPILVWLSNRMKVFGLDSKIEFYRLLSSQGREDEINNVISSSSFSALSITFRWIIKNLLWVDKPPTDLQIREICKEFRNYLNKPELLTSLIQNLRQMLVTIPEKVFECCKEILLNLCIMILKSKMTTENEVAFAQTVTNASRKASSCIESKKFADIIPQISGYPKSKEIQIAHSRTLYNAIYKAKSYEEGFELSKVMLNMPHFTGTEKIQAQYAKTLFNLLCKISTPMERMRIADVIIQIPLYNNSEDIQAEYAKSLANVAYLLSPTHGGIEISERMLKIPFFSDSEEIQIAYARTLRNLANMTNSSLLVARLREKISRIPFITESNVILAEYEKTVKRHNELLEPEEIEPMRPKNKARYDFAGNGKIEPMLPENEARYDSAGTKLKPGQSPRVM